jgi:SNF2 family DNA or RNA helicase
MIVFPPDNPHERVHNLLYTSARIVFIRVLQSMDEDVLEHSMPFLELILRIRQACCHAALVPLHCRISAQAVIDEEHSLKKVLDKSQTDSSLAIESLEKSRNALDENTVTECAICSDQMDEENAVVLTRCKHVFCQTCVNQVANHLCPLCHMEYSESDKIGMKDAKKSLEKKAAKPPEKRQMTAGDYNEVLGRSPKIQAMLNAVKELGPDEKCVIFSQWTNMLDIIQAEFTDLGFTYCRIDGSMSADQRIEAMEQFDTEECDTMQTPRFILCSLHACGTGINLTRGNVVFLMDCWWNSAVESQVCSSCSDLFCCCVLYCFVL